MKYYLPIFVFFVLITCLTSLLSCKSDDVKSSVDLAIRVQIPVEPDRLNPMLSRSGYAMDIYHYIFFPLAEFDPVTLMLSPLLIEEIPESAEIEDGPYKGDHKYQMRIRNEAVWHDGRPITGYDYLFTVKAAFNPKVEAAGWRAYLSEIKDVQVDTDDPKKFTVTVEGEYMLSLEITVNFNILPQHVYDTSKIMEAFELDQLRKEEFNDEEQKSLAQFADQFSDVSYSRDILVGSGPYQFEEWVTNQWIKISRVENWWGERFKDISVCFQNNPTEIEFDIIADETTSLTALKSGEIDVMAKMKSEAFMDLKTDPEYQDKLTFLTPTIMQYAYVAINNLDPILKDKRVRKALAAIVDTKVVIDDLMQGLARPTIGPFHPSKAYYADHLVPIQKDLTRAANFLEESGWEDTNENGTVDKLIDEQLEELTLSIMVSGAVGPKVALLMQEAGKKIGLEIVIDQKPMNLVRTDLRNRDYDMAILITRMSPFPDDPYQSWHTDNIIGSGTNRVGFGNDTSDAIIEKIRRSNTANERKELYRQFQEIIYEEQPMIFLFSPLARVIHNKSLNIISSSRRPGYFLNAAKKAS